LDALAAFPAGDVVQIGTTSGGPPPDTITLESTLEKVSPKKKVLTMHIPDLVTAGSFWLPMPCAGLLSRLQLVNDVDTATGDATVTPKIATVDVTGGLLTLTNPATAGTIATASPTAANVVARDTVLELVVGGSNSGAGGGTLTVEITQ